jgi:DNA-binding transcriptional LysR family regulator
MLDRLTLDQLRILIAVAETGTFSAAARRLLRVQSAISQSIQSLEIALDTTIFDRSRKPPLLTDAGRVLVDDARHVVRDVELLRARAEGLASEVEPELTMAVDAMFPNSLLMASLKALSKAFPHLPVTVFTEGLGGGPEQRLRDGVARLALYAPLPTGEQDFEAEYLVSIIIIPVVATDHPLASDPSPLTRQTLERHLQLVSTDRTPLMTGLTGNILSPRIWRFADLGDRLAYLLAGLGWCYMPVHLVEEHIAHGRLKQLDIWEHHGRVYNFPIYAVHARGRAVGRAGRWLLDDLRGRLAQKWTYVAEPPDEPPSAATPSPRRRGDQEPFVYFRQL